MIILFDSFFFQPFYVFFFFLFPPDGVAVAVPAAVPKYIREWALLGHALVVVSFYHSFHVFYYDPVRYPWLFFMCQYNSIDLAFHEIPTSLLEKHKTKTRVSCYAVASYTKQPELVNLFFFLSV